MKGEPRDLVFAWTRAFAAADLEAVLALYAQDATFIGTSSAGFTQSPADIRAYFQRVLKDRTPGRADVVDCIVQEHGDTAIVTLLDHIVWSDAYLPIESKGRATFVLQRRAERWLIVSFHRSEVPAPAGR